MRSHISRRHSIGGSIRLLALLIATAMVLALGATVAAAGPFPGSSSIPMDAYEPDNVPAAARYFSINSAPQAHTFHVLQDEDWIEFDAVEGRTYVIQTSYPDGGVVGVPDAAEVAGDYDGYPWVDTVLELYDSSGTHLLEYNDDGGPLFLSSRIVWTANSTGKLRVRALSFFNWIEGGPIYITGETEQADLATAEAKAELNEISPYIVGPGEGQYLLSVTEGSASISGSVTDSATGDPIAGADVYAMWWGGSAVPDSTIGSAELANGIPFFQPVLFQTETAADGNYYFGFLPAGQYDTWTSTRNTCMPYAGFGWPTFEIQDGEVVTNHDAALVRAAASGRVTNAAGEPIAFANVMAKAGSGWQTSTGTNENGCYWFDTLPTGETYTFHFDDFFGPYQAEWYDDELTEPSATVLPAGGPYDGTNKMVNVDAVLGMEPAIINGKVTDQRGKPLANHPVEGRSQTIAKTYTALTEADGTYTLRVDANDPPTQTVVVYFGDFTDNKHIPEYWKDTTNPASATVLAVTAGVPLNGVSASLDEIPPYLKGVVKDKETGAPLKGIEAWLYYDTPAGWLVKDYVRTDANGVYALRGPVNSFVPHKLRFFDPTEKYATEFWDDQPTFAEGDEILFGPAPPPAPPSLSSDEALADVAVPVGPFVANAELALKVPRATGPDRYDVAITTARELFPDWDKLEHVIIAAGEDEAAADALASAGLSWAYDAPVLLCDKSGPSPELLKAIREMGPSVQLHVAGGPNSLPYAAVAPILGLPNVKDSADRIAGSDRYSTAVAIAQRVDSMAAAAGRPADAVLVANGSDWEKFFDALALSAPSAGTGLPIVLVQEDAIPATTMSYLDRRAPSDIYVAGGPATVSDGVFNDLAATGAITQRWAGKDRYGTAAAVAKGAIARGWIGYNQMGIAARVPDAMSGGAAIGRKGGPLLLTQTDKLPGETATFLKMNKGAINSCLVFGGPRSVSEAVRSQISVILK